LGDLKNTRHETNTKSLNLNSTDGVGGEGGRGEAEEEEDTLILWHVYPFLGNDSKISNCTTAVAR
jgi:hypothetical protein